MENTKHGLKENAKMEAWSCANLQMWCECVTAVVHKDVPVDVSSAFPL